MDEETTVAEAPTTAPETAPAADPAPSPEGEGQAPAAPEAPAKPRTVEEAIAAYVARDNAGGEEVQEEEADPAGQPRDEQGRVAPKEAAHGAQEGEEGEGATEEQGDGEEAPQAFAVALMPRRDGEDPLELELTPEQIEKLGGPEDAREWLDRTRNGVMRRAQVLEERRGLEQLRAEVQGEREQFYADLEDDQRAQDLIVNHLRPEVQEGVLEALVASVPQETFERIVDRVLEFNRDPRERELAALKRRVPREEPKPEETSTRPEKVADLPPEIRQRSTAILDAVAGLAPESMPDDKFGAYYQDAVKGLVTYTELNGDDITPDDALEVLKGLGVLRKHGLSLPGGSDPAPASRTGRQSPPGSDQEEDAGSRFKERIQARKNASAVTPAGQAAALSGGGSAPQGRTVEERMKWFKKERGLN